MTAMSVTRSRPGRRRRTAADARAETLAAARRLLLEKGPSGVTLKAVAGEVGVTHANLLHHFGSAAELQGALMTMMCSDLAAALSEAVSPLRQGESSMEELVGMAFEAFHKGGAGHLAAWLVLTRETDKLAPVGKVIRDLADAIRRPDQGAPVERLILFVTMAAFADAVIGPVLRPMLGQSADQTEELIVRLAKETIRG
jgi:TetR/AcrR family transcriptional regulator, repressor for neighboring sulfatase